MALLRESPARNSGAPRVPKEVLRSVRRIEIGTRRPIDEVMAGAYHSSFKGRGMEFAEVREYVPGDDVRTIDWNVTARTGRPHVKQFVEERELTVVLAVDVSASGTFGSRARSKTEAAAMLGALLAFSAARNGDKVGLMLFSDRVERWIPPAKGRGHSLRCLREMLACEPEGRGTDIALAMAELRKQLRRRAVVVLVSDFLDDGYEQPLKLLAGKHDLLALGIVDPREAELPESGLVELEDAESGELRLIDCGDAAFRKNFAESSRRRRRRLADSFRRMGVDFVEVPLQDEMQRVLDPVISYFRRRARAH